MIITSPAGTWQLQFKSHQSFTYSIPILGTALGKGFRVRKKQSWTWSHELQTRKEENHSMCERVITTSVIHMRTGLKFLVRR